MKVGPAQRMQRRPLDRWAVRYATLGKKDVTREVTPTVTPAERASNCSTSPSRPRLVRRSSADGYSQRTDVLW